MPKGLLHSERLNMRVTQGLVEVGLPWLVYSGPVGLIMHDLQEMCEMMLLNIATIVSMSTSTAMCDENKGQALTLARSRPASAKVGSGTRVENPCRFWSTARYEVDVRTTGTDVPCNLSERVLWWPRRQD